MATFAYGGITPGEAHPQLNLCVGPSEDDSSFDLGNDQFTVTYAPTFSGTASYGGGIGTGSLSPTLDLPSIVATPPFSNVQLPSVPASTNTLFPGAPANTTFNIWQMYNITSSTQGGVTYQANFGPQFPSGYTGARYRMVTTQDGSAAIHVNAQNSVCQMFRVYPIACDAVYSGSTMLYYPPLKGSNSPNVSVGSRLIKATGGENCGFQVHFTHSKVTRSSNPNTGALDGSIEINWGDLFQNPYLSVQQSGNGSTATQNRTNLTQFSLVLSPSSVPILYFYNPQTQTWQDFPLHGPIFGAGDEFHVFVHYAGPTMLIGFDAQSTEWNCFTPFADFGDYSTMFYPRIPAHSNIEITFKNITATFQYGPIAFNNYHPESVGTVADFTAQKDQGYVNIQLTAPRSKAADVLKAATISTEFQTHAFRATDLDSPANFKSGPTYYPDWPCVNIERPGHVYQWTGLLRHND
jgi:hypothetical protein